MRDRDRCRRDKSERLARLGRKSMKQLTEQTITLARKEVELAKAEMAVKAKRFAVGAGAFGGAGLIGVLALDALTAAAILGLAEAVDAWLAALIVTAAYAALAGLLAVVGSSRVETGHPAGPRGDCRKREGGRRMGQGEGQARPAVRNRGRRRPSVALSRWDSSSGGSCGWR
jgi:hypothetical protein